MPPKDQAYALKYKALAEIPSLIAGGMDAIAKEILKVAAEHNVPIEHNPDLCALLSQIQSNQTIPEEAFDLVAEIISFLYLTDKEWREDHSFLEPVIGKP